jgi:dTDP-4-dehydrorhamnose 3,5-epimerase
MIRFQKTPINDLLISNNNSFRDDRGIFKRLLSVSDYKDILNSKNINQVNYSLTQTIGSIRGLHCQKKPYAEIKIVQCINGAVYDIVVDLRKNSSTFLKWFGLELSKQNGLGIIIPEGCAHGFQTLKENSELIYFHTTPYHPEAEFGVNYIDPMLQIKWPLKLTTISEKDTNYSFLSDNFQGI